LSSLFEFILTLNHFGRKDPTKLTPEAIDFIQQQKQKNPELSGAELAKLVESTFGISVTKRTIERPIKEMRLFKKNSI
jgi:transposase